MLLHKNEEYFFAFVLCNPLVAWSNEVWVLRCKVKKLYFYLKLRQIAPAQNHCFVRYTFQMQNHELVKTDVEVLCIFHRFLYACFPTATIILAGELIIVIESIEISIRARRG